LTRGLALDLEQCRASDYHCNTLCTRNSNVEPRGLGEGDQPIDQALQALKSFPNSDMNNCSHRPRRTRRPRVNGPHQSGRRIFTPCDEDGAGKSNLKSGTSQTMPRPARGKKLCNALYRGRERARQAEAFPSPQLEPLENAPAPALRAPGGRLKGRF
jgi:hypothetical protein